jgi:uncharacterized membrane protein (UPF0182 family)
MAVVETAPPRLREAPAGLPEVGLPRAPSVGRLWSRILGFAAVVVGLYLLDQVANLLLQFWFLQSLGLEDVFWTNFWTGAVLFGIAFVAFAAVVAAPAYAHGLRGVARRRAVQIGLLAGVVAGYFFCQTYLDYLALLNGQSFGKTDPVFHKDYGFYVFNLPAYWTTLNAAVVCVLVALAASVVCALLASRGRPRPEGMGRVAGVLGRVATPYTLGVLVVLGAVAALDVWLRRYSIPVRSNIDHSIPNGAQVVDVTGFFSTKNAITVETLAVLMGTVAVALRLRRFRAAYTAPGAVTDWRRVRLRVLLPAALPGLLVSIAFVAVVGIRVQTEVTPNEPVVQLPYIKRHIDATNEAYGLDKVTTREFIPKGPRDPKPRLDEMLRHPTLANAPLWPGYVSWLERLIDPEYADRALQTGGDTTIYGPTLATYQQQQKLRPYYDFMDIDTTRYYVGGRERLFASAVRELPLLEPQPWLAWWGQRFVLFTHGYGLVMAGLNKITRTGEPRYDSHEIPTEIAAPEVAAKNQAIYYGEGSGSMAYSDLAKIEEHDRPTSEGRAQVRYPPNVRAGVKIDSFLKRAVFGYKSRQFLDIVFSDLIKSGSRVHYYRTPLERIERIAPFLYLDTDPYAVTTGDGISWMVNGMTTTDRYPYSVMGDLGDKSDRRTPTPRPTRRVNYVKDSVKATVDAYTGQVRLHKFADEPIVNTWAKVYPDMFQPRESMPVRVRRQVQYPVQLFHIQFDDVYVYTHQKDPLTFFSQEDLYDDGDEVVGSVLDEGRAITFSLEPYYWIAEPGKNGLPASREKTQFAMSMAFTPENALNLRAIATVYMDGEDYGKITMLQVPKGKFFQGPEQADSAIDQDPFISQQAGLWTRRGLELIRGHTTPLLVDGELLYVEPFFIRSLQNPLPRLKRVVVVYRGEAYMAETLPIALRAALNPFPKFPIRPGPELGGEPPFVKRGARVGQAGR